jgi:hypothetical protein
MAISYADTIRNSRMATIVTAAGSTAVIEIFSGAESGKTSGTFNADPGTKLASLPLSNPIAGSASAGLLTFSTITSATGLASGTPASARIKTVASGAPSTVVAELDCAVGSGSLNFASAISSGGTVSISSATLDEGNP